MIRLNDYVLTLADSDAWFDICTSRVLDVNEPTYMIATDTTRSFTECRCFVNNGYFLLNVTDLRLKSKDGRNCSSTTLQINSKVFSCDIAKQDFGYMFNRNKVKSKKDLFISIRSLSDENVADMIWLTLIPEGKPLFSYQQIKFS